MSTSGGDIDALVPADLNADVEIRTSGGSIYNNFGNVNNAKITKSSIIGKFNNGGNKFVCKTSGGDIQIKQK